MTRFLLPVTGVRALGLMVALLAATPARADTEADCERHALAFSKTQGGTLTAVKIEREDFPVSNRYNGKVGSQPVSTELMGFARVTSPEGTRRMRFVCLHDGKRAVYVGLLE
jgi:hypothetical protein